MGTESRLANGVLATTGATICHAIAYGLLSVGVGFTGHAATDAIFTLLLSLVFAVFGMVVVRAAVSRGSLVTIGVVQLALLQAAMFVAQELVEGIGSGAGLAATLTALPVLVGVALQPIVAFVLLFLVRRAERLGEGLATRVAAVPPTGAGWLWNPVPSLVPCRIDARHLLGSRAPPR